MARVCLGGKPFLFLFVVVIGAHAHQLDISVLRMLILGAVLYAVLICGQNIDGTIVLNCLLIKKLLDM